jgi:hypothetical protein
MAANRLIASVALLGVLVASPALAADRQRSREGRARSSEQSERTGRAVPRSQSPAQQNREVQPQARSSRPPDNRSYDSRSYNNRSYDNRTYNNRSYDNRRNYAYRPYQSYQRPYYPYYGSRGYGARTVIVPRYITPRYVTVVPYRPYVYRPSIGIGVYYGTGGVYPYGYTPRGYYDPIPGQAYGGLRITGASRVAQVFADGYYVGIVNDFDGIFQHLNLEAGPHRIEIVDPALPPIAFDVMIQPGRTLTYRVDAY